MFKEASLKKVKIKSLLSIAEGIVEESKMLGMFTDAELRAKTEEFKHRYAHGESLEELLPEAFAVCSEVAWRVLRMRPYPVQVVGGIILNAGNIAEMRTGEGKTLVAVLPAYLNAISGKGVHVVTVNDYLAKRDSEWMGKVYKALGLTVGLVRQGGSPDEKRAAYACDITYCTNTELGFDYLRDNMVTSASDRVMRGYNFAIIDEVDSILIDEARTPLIISGFSGESSDGYKKADAFVKSLNGITITDISEEAQSKIGAILDGVEDPYAKYSDYDYVAEEKQHTAVLTELGDKKMYEYYGIDESNIDTEEATKARYYVSVALKANTLYKKNVDYIVASGGIHIVDLGTGRVMPGRRFSYGIHQGIEAKEGVEIKPEMVTVASATYQNFFRLYDKIGGMTGTAMTEKEEFLSIYGLPVVEIPTNKPVVRVDHEDLVFATAHARLDYLVQTIKEKHKTGQPILVGTSSVEKSEILHRLLLANGIEHSVLNAKNHENEAAIIAQAGRLGAVTIATNMAGRGTDIILGGNPEFMALQYFRDNGYSEDLISEMTEYSETDDEEIGKARAEFAQKKKEIQASLADETARVLELGGLFVIGTERHVSRRIDNQLRGRAGRQGDAGESIFLLSLEDDLMRLFGADRVASLLKAGLPADKPIDAKILSGAIERAQSNVESTHFAQRKRVLDYDVINAMVRDSIYDQRNAILDYKSSDEFQAQYASCIRTYVDRVVCAYVHKKKISDADKNKISEQIDKDFLGFFSENRELFCNVGNKERAVKEALTNALLNMVEQSDKVMQEAIQNEENVLQVKRANAISVIDEHWSRMMETMDDAKDDATLAMFSHNDPLTNYKMLINQSFYIMRFDIAKAILRNLSIVAHSRKTASQN